MTQPVIEGMAAYKVSVNDDIVDKGYFNMSFDGDNLDVAGVQGDKLIVMSLDQDDIMNLLATPASNKSLIERLSADYDQRPMIEEGPILEVLEKSSKKSSNKGTRRKRKHQSSKKSRRRTPSMARKKMLPTHTPVVGPTPRYYKDK
tara:strand:- start:1695 stop:2132 length:438 start_codon:yes stop_codon:yes gene_type:complete